MARVSGGRRILVGILAGVVVVITVFAVRAYLREQGSIRRVEALREVIRRLERYAAKALGRS